jgi:hypothetical protein
VGVGVQKSVQAPYPHPKCKCPAGTVAPSDAHCGRIERWVLAAAELLAAEPRVYLHTPCPRCAQGFAYHRDGADERVRTRALRVDASGCRCLACGATWSPDRFHWLARLLGCPALPA